MSMSVLKTLITATATLIVPTQRVPTLVLVEQVGLETGSRVQVFRIILLYHELLFGGIPSRAEQI